MRFERYSVIFAAACCAAMLTGSVYGAGLPDTGQDTCYDGVSMVACTAENTGDAASYPRQDGQFGRDVAAAVGASTKIGGGVAGFDYSKICNSGELAGQDDCPADPNLGNDTNEWGCTQDNITGLMWEVKVADNTHLRHSEWTYTWYNSDPNTDGGDPGQPDLGSDQNSDNCLDDTRCDTEKYITDVNAGVLCGSND